MPVRSCQDCGAIPHENDV
jgi:hypothetical protein